MLAYSAVAVCSAAAHFSGFSLFMGHFFSASFLFWCFSKFDFEDAVFVGGVDGVWNHYFWQI